MKITKTIYTETGHRLLNYNGKCANLHGHSYRWDVTVEGSVDDKTGFVVDFSDIKKVINETYDHVFVVQKGDPILNTELDSKVLVLDVKPSVENLILYILPKLKKTMNVINIRCQETESSYAEWTNE